MANTEHQIFAGDSCPSCQVTCTREDEGEPYCQACLKKFTVHDPRLPGFRWTLDCQGKQDLDGPILELSTRYWPRGGGYHTSRVTAGEVQWEGNEARPHILPSAHASIMFFEQTLAQAEFRAETEEEVKAMVERWAGDQVARITAAIKRAYRSGDTDDPIVQLLRDHHQQTGLEVEIAEFGEEVRYTLQATAGHAVNLPAMLLLKLKELAYPRRLTMRTGGVPGSWVIELTPPPKDETHRG